MHVSGPYGTFEVPDEWLREAGAEGFVPAGPAYASAPEPHLIAAIDTVEPPRRTPGVLGLHRGQMVSVLRGLVLGEGVPPVPVEMLTAGPYCYMLRDGFHRYHASIALGYTHLPVQQAAGL